MVEAAAVADLAMYMTTDLEEVTTAAWLARNRTQQH